MHEMPSEVTPIELTPGKYAMRFTYMPTEYWPSSRKGTAGARLEYQICDALRPVALTAGRTRTGHRLSQNPSSCQPGQVQPPEYHLL